MASTLPSALTSSCFVAGAAVSASINNKLTPRRFIRQLFFARHRLLRLAGTHAAALSSSASAGAPSYPRIRPADPPESAAREYDRSRAASLTGPAETAWRHPAPGARLS